MMNSPRFTSRRVVATTAIAAAFAAIAVLVIHSPASALHAQSRSGFHLREAFADREDGWDTTAIDLRHAGPDEVVEQDPTDPRRRSRRQVHRDIGTVWFTDQAGIELGEVRAQLRAALRPYGPSFVLHSMWLLLVYGLDETLIEGLPPGIPVALELEGNGQLAASSELRAIERASLPATLFDVPAGYVREACPGIRRPALTDLIAR